ncbi:immunity 22 family protein [Deinococcus sp. YIM 134068]|uniref:immunity 22 family protein n=1 Tax=Deinococcus lichenicola TaxID=3118910 RepID=UPI002F91D883
MNLYEPEVITLWVVRSSDEQALLEALEFKYDEVGEVVLSPFAQAFRIGWYNDDFAELHFGRPTSELIREAAQSYRTLDEQALRRLPEGEWNGLYLLASQAGEAWTAPSNRPPMPHDEVSMGDAVFKLLDTFHVLYRPT